MRPVAGRSPRISDLRWIRPPRQARSRETLERLLDASEAVIGEKGFADAGVADIAARAGCSTGAFYRRFRDKAALIEALLERLTVEFRATLEEAVDPSRWEGASAREILEGYLQFALLTGRDQAGLRRAQLALALGDPAMGQRLYAMQKDGDRQVGDLIAQRRDEIRHPRPEIAIPFVLEQLRCMLLNRLEGALLYSSLDQISDEDFVSEALASASAYLQLPLADSLRSAG